MSVMWLLLTVTDMSGSNYDIDEAFDDDDLCVDGEAELKQDDSMLIEGQSLCPSTDLIIIIEDPGNTTCSHHHHHHRYCHQLFHRKQRHKIHAQISYSKINYNNIRYNSTIHR